MLDMLEKLHFKLMTRIKEKKEKMLTLDCEICAVIKKKLDENMSASRDHRTIRDSKKIHDKKW